jgi:hypothetical protein
VPGSNRMGRLKDRAQRQSVGEDVGDAAVPRPRSGSAVRGSKE